MCAAGTERVGACILDVIEERRIPDCDADVLAIADGDIDDPRVEAPREHTHKMGRRRCDVRELLKGNTLLASIVELSRICHEPLDHHRHFIMQRTSKSELGSEGGHISRLTLGKSLEMIQESAELLQHPKWITEPIR